eukprot:14224246-Alexandrium_andersonii.AAC.1
MNARSPQPNACCQSPTQRALPERGPPTSLLLRPEGPELASRSLFRCAPAGSAFAGRALHFGPAQTPTLPASEP